MKMYLSIMLVFTMFSGLQIMLHGMDITTAEETAQYLAGMFTAWLIVSILYVIIMLWKED